MGLPGRRRKRAHAGAAASAPAAPSLQRRIGVSRTRALAHHVLWAAVLAGCAIPSFRGRGERAPRVASLAGTQPFESRVDPADVDPPALPSGTEPPGTEPPRTDAPGPEPLDEGPLVELEVPGHRPAIVSIPRGARGPRPVIVAAHGAGDRPEPHCAIWRLTIGDRGFVLCPTGTAMGSGAPGPATRYFYRSHVALGREISAALDALRARYPEHIDLAAPLYAGFSQGAIQGVPVLHESPAGFARAVLIEGGYGGYHEWSALAARRYRERGGERALFACGVPACVEKARRSAALLTRAGVEARVLDVEGAGHSYGGRMEEEVRRAFGWVVEGDPRWGAEARAEAAAAAEMGADTGTAAEVSADALP